MFEHIQPALLVAIGAAEGAGHQLLIMRRLLGKNRPSNLMRKVASENEALQAMYVSLPKELQEDNDKHLQMLDELAASPRDFDVIMDRWEWQIPGLNAMSDEKRRDYRSALKRTFCPRADYSVILIDATAMIVLFNGTVGLGRSLLVAAGVVIGTVLVDCFRRFG